MKKVSTAGNTGLISSEVMEIVFPFYPTARKLKKDHQLVTILHNAVKRFSNPNFKHRFSKNPKESAEYLFDLLQALIAKQELGSLRNPNYILPLLEDKNFTIRLKALACLAFMSGKEIIPALVKTSETDIEPNVRRLAKWSLTVNSSAPSDLKTVISGYFQNSIVQA